jgi:hypothetical protein
MSDLPPNVVAKWSASTDKGEVVLSFESGPDVEPDASMEEAVLAQNGKRLDARSGVCLLVAVYVPALKLGAVIHLNRNEDLWPEQEALIRGVFTRFPQICDAPYVGFVSNKAVEAETPDMASQAKELVRTLAPTARIEDVWVNSFDHPDWDRELLEPELLAMESPMSVEVHLGTAVGKLLILDDYGKERTIDLTT